MVEKFSADAYRLVLIDSPVLAGEDFSVTDKDIADKQRKLDTLRNTLEFFLLYAAADDWQADPDRHTVPPSPASIFDRWLLVRLSALTSSLTAGLADYNLPAATRPLLEFIEDLSNWYVRRNRKRFWKTEDSADKQDAYHTLYFTLWRLSHLIAPLCPFLAEEMYRQLGGDLKSVHLADWLEYELTDERLIGEMQRTRHYIAAGLALRAEAGIRVRQPLARLTVTEQRGKAVDIEEEFEAIVLEELNVKSLEMKVADEPDVELDTELTEALRQEGWVRELVRHIQVLRKTAGLEVENRIDLRLRFADRGLAEAFKVYAAYIKNETLAVGYASGPEIEDHADRQTVELNGSELTLSLKKA